MKIQNLLIVIFVIGFIGTNSACLKISVSNRWKVPNSDLSILVERSKPQSSNKTYKRTIVLQENYSTKNKIEMAPENGEYSRTNIYRTSDKTFLLKDFWNDYEIHPETKMFKKLDSATRLNGEFVGAFDENENGAWRFIPLSERKEIPLGETKLK